MVTTYPKVPRWDRGPGGNPLNRYLVTSGNMTPMAAARPPRKGSGKPDCPLTDTMRLISGAWTPFIIWYLREHPRRFGDLRREIGPVSAKVLAARLKQMEEQGVVTRTVRPTSPPTVEYAITPLGARLKPILDSIVDVGKQLKRREHAGRAR